MKRTKVLLIDLHERPPTLPCFLFCTRSFDVSQSTESEFMLYTWKTVKFSERLTTMWWIPQVVKKKVSETHENSANCFAWAAAEIAMFHMLHAKFWIVFLVLLYSRWTDWFTPSPPPVYLHERSPTLPCFTMLHAKFRIVLLSLSHRWTDPQPRFCFVDLNGWQQQDGHPSVVRLAQCVEIIKVGVSHQNRGDRLNRIVWA